ncbi:MAG TPA: hypothetical protein VJ723_02395, partial [Candidatus Angelobacter sp.]|nr:hypothetical protein [Candidatus Angelobacter sp.]
MNGDAAGKVLKKRPFQPPISANVLAALADYSFRGRYGRPGLELAVNGAKPKRLNSGNQKLGVLEF